MADELLVLHDLLSRLLDQMQSVPSGSLHYEVLELNKACVHFVPA